MKTFRILRKIDVSPAFVAFLCAYYYFDPAQTFAPFLLSITLHEAAHLLVLRVLRARIHRLRLSGCGATILTEPLSYSREILVAAAGPTVNLAILMLMAQDSPALALVNFCLFAYNMLPLYPLDGGRILRAALHLMFSEHTAAILEKIISLLCLAALTAFACYLTCVWHAGLWPILVCALLLVRIAGVIFPERRILQIGG